MGTSGRCKDVSSIRNFGRPIDAFFAKQPADLRPVLIELRTMIEAAAPMAKSSLKWGMPFFMIGDAMMCALGGHRVHVNLILPGPPGTYADPNGLLQSDGKSGRRLQLVRGASVPRAQVRRWLRTAVARALEEA